MHGSFVPLALLCILTASANAVPVHRRQVGGGDSNLNITEQPLRNWWCGAGSEINTKETADRARTIGVHMFDYIASDVQTMPLLRDCNCMVPVLPQRSSSGLQAVADLSLDLTYQILMYRMAVRNLELQGILPQQNESTAKLELLTILLDHYHREVEKYLQLSRCSCDGVNCTLRTIDFALVESKFTQMISSSCCTSKCLLKAIVKKILDFNYTLQLSLGEGYNNNWSLCKTVEIAVDTFKVCGQRDCN